MKTMKLIDIILKAINGEEVPMFKYGERRYTYNKEYQCFDDLDNDDYCKIEFYLIELNKEVEIIEDTPQEDNKIEKIDIRTDELGIEYIKGKSYGKMYGKSAIEMAYKINEIIDKINGGA